MAPKLQRVDSARFLFAVSCACEQSQRFKHSLCFSSFGIAIGANSLLSNGDTCIGTLAAMLSLTSIAYHATHSPRVRGADVLLLVLVGLLGTTQNLLGMSKDGISLSGCAGVACVCALCAIQTSPIFYVGNTHASNLIQLPWHVAVHMLAGVGLLLLSAGNAYASRKPFFILSPLQTDEWVRAAGYAACLVSFSSIVYMLSGHEQSAVARRAQNHVRGRCDVSKTDSNSVPTPRTPSRVTALRLCDESPSCERVNAALQSGRKRC